MLTLTELVLLFPHHVMVELCHLCMHVRIHHIALKFEQFICRAILQERSDIAYYCAPLCFVLLCFSVLCFGVLCCSFFLYCICVVLDPFITMRSCMNVVTLLTPAPVTVDPPAKHHIRDVVEFWSRP